MAKKIKTILGSDGYEYPITSYELVLDENGESLKKKLQNINIGNIDLTGYATEEYVDGMSPYAGTTTVYTYENPVFKDGWVYVLEETISTHYKNQPEYYYNIEVTLDDGTIIFFDEDSISNQGVDWIDMVKDEYHIMTGSYNKQDGGGQYLGFELLVKGTPYDTPVSNVTKVVMYEKSFTNKIKYSSVDSVNYDSLRDVPQELERIVNNQDLPLNNAEHYALECGYDSSCEFDKSNFNESPYDTSNKNNVKPSNTNGIRIYTKYSEGVEKASGFKLTNLTPNFNYRFLCNMKSTKANRFSSDIVANLITVDSNGNKSVSSDYKSETGFNIPISCKANYEYYVVFRYANKYDFTTLYLDSMGLVIDYSYINSTATYYHKDLRKILTQDNIAEYTPTENYHPATKKYVDDNEPAKVLSESEIVTISANDLQSIFNTETPVEARVIAQDYYQTAIDYTLTDYKNKKIIVEFMNETKGFLPIKQEEGQYYAFTYGDNYYIYIDFGLDENQEPNINKTRIEVDFYGDDVLLLTDCVIKVKELRKLNNDFLESDATIVNSLTIGTTDLFDEEKGELSFSNGNYNASSGKYSHAEGSYTQATNEASHSEGVMAIASGIGSHAEGYNTRASSRYQHVQGKYNIEDATNTYAHIVGNGNGNSDRSNAHTLDWNGNAWFQGNVYIDGTPTYDNDLTTKKYVDNKVADLVDSAPGTLDTLKELATALGNDANFATTVSNQIGNKVDKVEGKGLSTNDLTNELKTNYDTAYTHSQSTHAPSNAQKNSDITKAEIEAKLIGNITTHTHSQYLTEHQSLEAYALKTDLHSHSNKATLDGISSTNISNWNSAHTHSQSAHFSGNYNDLTNKPTIPTIPNSLPANGGNADTVNGFSIWSGTQAEYDAISSKDANTIYLIKEG